MRRMCLAALVVFTGAAQTQIDLRTQAKSVDFTAATTTKPVKTGTTLPGTCTLGEMFFNTDAPAGNNVYGCTAVNTWTAQGPNLTLATDSQAVGSEPTINFMTGPGLMSVMADTGSQIDISWALDTATVQTQTGEQSGTVLLCSSTSGSNSAYQCSLTPVLAAYTAGMTLHWKPDVNGGGGPTTLNIDTLGAVPVKLGDGASDPAATDIVAGELYDIWYDGAQFRLMTSMPSIASGANTGPLVFDGSTSTLADGSMVTWSCGSGSAAQCTTNWTVPTGVNWVHVQLFGAGGGGQGGYSGSGGGSGGGGGGMYETVCPTNPGGTVRIAVGLGGAGGQGANGGGDAGGNSSFGTCIAVTGGTGGSSSGSGAGGVLNGLDAIYHTYGGTDLVVVTADYCTPGGGGGRVPMRLDGGACGAGGSSADGYPGGTASAGGGGGGGALGSMTVGPGGISALAGAGGNGGGYNTATSRFVACTAGTAPGGGGGGGGANTGTACTGSPDCSGCAGASGEVRVYYSK